MPKMDGFELFNRIEKEDNKVKICLFSAPGQLTSNYKNLFQSSLYLSLCVVGWLCSLIYLSVHLGMLFHSFLVYLSLN